MSLASIQPRALEALIAQADLIVIGVGGPRVKRTDIGTIVVEETMKGRAPKRLVVRPPIDPDFLCDITSLEVGKRALFFLTSTNGGFHIMHFGRGAFALVDTSLAFDWPDDFVKTRELREVCRLPPESLVSECALDRMRQLIARFATPQKNSAMVFSEDEPTVVVPAGEVSCAETSLAKRGILTRCSVGGADAGLSPPPLRGLLECWRNRWCTGEPLDP